MILNNYLLLCIFGVFCIILAYIFGCIVGYKKSEEETAKWIDRMTEEHRKEREKTIEDMYAEHLAREEKMNENI